MKETLEITQSGDLLNEFLGQQGGEGNDPIEPTTVINDGGTKDSETIEAPTPVITDNKTGMEVLTELPEGLEGDPENPEGDVTPENSEGDSDPTEDQGQYSFKALAGYLSEEGIIDFEDGEGIEDTPEVLFESVKKTIESKVQEYKDSIPDKAKKLIEYLEKGGTVDSYINAVQKPFDITNIDLESESDQELVVREYLKLQDYSPEEIDDVVKTYSDSLILDKQAKLAAKQVTKYYDKVEEGLVAQAEQEQELRKQQYDSYIATVNTTIDTSEAIAGLPVTTKEKAEFKKYLLARDKEGLTAYERELSEDPVKTQLELAYIKFMKYDFSKAIKKGETKATQRMKDIFKSSETNSKGGKSINQVADSLDMSGFKFFKKK